MKKLYISIFILGLGVMGDLSAQDRAAGGSVICDENKIKQTACIGLKGQEKDFCEKKYSDLENQGQSKSIRAQ